MNDCIGYDDYHEMCMLSYLECKKCLNWWNYMW